MCPPWIRGRVGGLSTSQCSSLLTPGQNTPSSGRHMSPLPNVPCVTVVPAPRGRQSHPSGPSLGWTRSGWPAAPTLRPAPRTAWPRFSLPHTCSSGVLSLCSSLLRTSSSLETRCPRLSVSSSPVAVLHGGFWSKTVTLAYCLLFFSSKILTSIYNFIFSLKLTLWTLA